MAGPGGWDAGEVSVSINPYIDRGRVPCSRPTHVGKPAHRAQDQPNTRGTDAASIATPEQVSNVSTMRRKVTSLMPI